MNKRGQAALEFLMTYGWAILVVMVIIGALAYFGVLNPMMFVPERCTMDTGFSCDQAYRINGSEVLIQLENNFGRDITITNFTATYSAGEDVVCAINMKDYPPTSGAGDNTVRFMTGDVMIFHFNHSVVGSIDCSLAAQEGRKIRMNLRMDYYPTGAGSDFATYAQGSVLTRVQDN